MLGMRDDQSRPRRVKMRAASRYHRDDAVAVMLDFVNPIRAGRRLLDQHSLARLDPAGRRKRHTQPIPNDLKDRCVRLAMLGRHVMPPNQRPEPNWRRLVIILGFAVGITALALLVRRWWW
jgi:hypothetical protein